jgi:hypothetical protein
MIELPSCNRHFAIIEWIYPQPSHPLMYIGGDGEGDGNGKGSTKRGTG